MSDVETEKQPSRFWKKIRLVICIVVLVFAALYVPAKFLAVRYTNKGTELYDQGKYDEAKVQFKRALRVFPGFKPAREQLAELEGNQKQKAKR
jgi:Tfp pilus assembly protein PilF